MSIFYAQTKYRSEETDRLVLNVMRQHGCSSMDEMTVEQTDEGLYRYTYEKEYI